MKGKSCIPENLSNPQVAVWQTEMVMRTGVRGFHQGTRAYSPSSRCRIYDCNLSFNHTAIYFLQCGADHI